MSREHPIAGCHVWGPSKDTWLRGETRWRSSWLAAVALLMVCFAATDGVKVSRVAWDDDEIS